MRFYSCRCIPNIRGKHKKFALIGIFFIYSYSYIPKENPVCRRKLVPENCDRGVNVVCQGFKRIRKGILSQYE